MRAAAYILLGLSVIALSIWLAWLTSPDPKFNIASFEETPIVVSVAPIEDAITLAQYESVSGETVTLLVTAYDNNQVSGIDLADLGAPRLRNPFAVLKAIEDARILDAAKNIERRIQLPVTDLLPAGPDGDRHIAIGTNFPEHAEEASSHSVFIFPKFGTATPSRTRVSAPARGLLDYEVELCMRFDRPVETLVDFDAAVKGLFLCADFTDRIALLKLADRDNLDSGYGFSDAKSGPGFFPTGPFLVIPRDWGAFVSDIRMATNVNGDKRQDARGREMILDFRALTGKALWDMSDARFYYKGDFFKLAPGGCIESDMTLMSGTSEGVIFTMPTRRDYIEMLIAYFLSGGPFSGKSLIEIGTQIFIENEIQSGHYLQPGDIVTYQSSTLGDIVVQVNGETSK